jgi:hypothetical protein
MAGGREGDGKRAAGAGAVNFGTKRGGRLAILIERDHVGRAAAEGRDAAGTRGASTTGRS